MISLILTLEQAPHPQAQTTMRYSGGNLVIGRGADADWTINDPDMFVSRAHCTISGSDGEYAVTDSSRGGLFIDGADKALGAGKTTDLRDGSRFRMGDFVFSAQFIDEPIEYIPDTTGPDMSRQPVSADDDPFGLSTPAPQKPSPAPQNGSSVGFDADDFFSTPVERAEPEPEPEGRPEPFESGKASSFFGEEPEDEKKDDTPFFDDPFTLGKLDPPNVVHEVPADATPSQEEALPDPIGEPEEPDEPPVEVVPDPVVSIPDPEPPVSQTRQTPPPEISAGSSDAARDAFLRGLGIDVEDFSDDDPVAQMEDMGKRYRLLIEGLTQMLRARAQEKQNARLAQTIIGHSDVNPLKFTPNIEDAVGSTVKNKGHGYLSPDLAINGAFRDLAEHHVNSWNGVQAALRRMIDRFDPAELEEELKDLGTLEALLAGGRRAKLWETYEERYRQIAQSAEERFLGDVGSDFRDAYENTRGDKS